MTSNNGEIAEKKKIAAFVNKDSFYKTINPKIYLSILENFADVFTASEEADKSYDNLYTGVSADFRDYSYIILINNAVADDDCAEYIKESCQRYYLESICKSVEYLSECMKIFDKDKYCGMLTPHIDFLNGLNTQVYKLWAKSFCDVKQAFAEGEVYVPLNIKKPPIYLAGGVAIIKTDAIKNLDKINFENLNFSDINFVLPLIAQSNGYLTQNVISKVSLLNNLHGYESHCLWLEKSMEVFDAFCEQHGEWIRQSEQCHLEREKYYEAREESLKERTKYLDNLEAYYKQREDAIAQTQNNIEQTKNYIEQTKEYHKQFEDYHLQTVKDLNNQIFALKARADFKQSIKNFLRKNK